MANNDGRDAKKTRVSNNLVKQMMKAGIDFEMPDIIYVPKKSEGDAKRSKKVEKTSKTTSKGKKVEQPQKQQQQESKDAAPPLYCVCRVPTDPYLVQCEGCQIWLHPNCIGKGQYTRSVNPERTRRARVSDEEYYRQPNQAFRCLNCEAFPRMYTK